MGIAWFLPRRDRRGACFELSRMIPLRDENPSSTVPVVTRTIIVLNCLVFVYEIMLGEGLRPFMFQWGLVPERLTLALRYHEEPVMTAGVTLVTSMFLHGGWLHLLGNMWYLSIFGDNIEDRLGKARYLLFYLLIGALAGTMHYLVNPSSRLPTVGASGAIAGVLGAYAVTFPRARVITLLPLFPFFQVVALRAVWALGLWFVFQFFSGALSLGIGNAGGTAWWAHIGGFVIGAVTMKLMTLGRAPSRVLVE